MPDEIVDVEAVEVTEEGSPQGDPSHLPALREEHVAAVVNLFGDASPVEVVERATDIAKALAAVIEQQQLYKLIRGRKHVYVEGWTLLGSMLGVFPIVEWTRKIEDGWEAKVEARTLNGAVVGSAEAMCSRSESKWKNDDEYSIRSMAQTRATSKALRLPLGFVMTLAGYEATPREEIVEEDEDSRRGRVQPAREHHPAHDLPAGFPAGPDLANRIGEALGAIHPAVDWRATWDGAILMLYDAERKDLTEETSRSAWIRLANIAERLHPYSLSMPPDQQVIADAFSWAFDGITPVTIVYKEVDDSPADAPLGNQQPEIEDVEFGNEDNAV